MNLNKVSRLDTYTLLNHDKFSYNEEEPDSTFITSLMPAISIVIATRDRNELVLQTVESIMENSFEQFELIIVDQSKNQLTKESLDRYSGDARLHYVHSDLIGLSRSRNLGIQLARAEIIAMTDDDCIVLPGWLDKMLAAFNQYPLVGLVFGQVIAVSHDTSLGFIPDYRIEKVTLGRLPLDKLKMRGIGACMGIRKKTWEMLGGFDEMLGAGGLLRSCEDGDMAFRTLLSGWYVLETPDLIVHHAGFRTFSEGRLLTKRDWYGIAAAYSKYLRCWNFTGLIILLHEFFFIAVLQFLVNLVLWRRPFGMLRISSFIIGLVDSFKIPINRKYYKYRDDSPI